MRTIQILRSKPPRSCGRVSSQAYYEWKCYHNQLWRFPECQVKPEEAIDPSRPMEIIQRESEADHQESIRRGPRRGDHVYRGDEFIGEVAWFDRKDKAVCIFQDGKYREVLSSEQFTNKASPRGRARWLLV